MKLESAPTLESMKGALGRVFELAGGKILDLDRTWDVAGGKGAPVFTVEGKYTTRGWTEWTQGFQYGMAILQFDAVRDPRFLELGRSRTIERMAPHVSHVGVHDHGFNNISTYGNLRRLMREEAIAFDRREMDFYELALKVSGAVQAARWTPIPSDPDSAGGNRNAGFVYSFNGPHSLFADTMRSLRSLVVAHQLGHILMGEHDERINLLVRAIHHARTTYEYAVFYGNGRDAYDTPGEKGRVAHESIFNVVDGRYRCASTQQGYSPFSTWTRGLAWVMLGMAELAEYLQSIEATECFLEYPRFYESVGKKKLMTLSQRELGTATRDHLNELFIVAASAAADWWLTHSFDDGMVYWDAGAPGIPRGNDYSGASDPFNEHEPIDSSAAAIAGQGFWRLANYLEAHNPNRAAKYRAAALVIARTLFAEPYLSTDSDHQGLILHSIYHRPNGWDHVPKGRKIPCGESSMWGDYHAMELALLLKRELNKEPYITFFDQT